MKDTMLNYYKYLALPACLALVFGMPLSAQAQGAGAQPSDQGPPTEGAPAENAPAEGDMGQPGGGVELDDQTKEKFVGAYVEIKDVQQKYTKKLEDVSNEDKARELQKEAQAEMVEIVESNDMSVNEYNEVVGAISSDPELRMEIEEMAQARSN